MKNTQYFHLNHCGLGHVAGKYLENSGSNVWLASPAEVLDNYTSLCDLPSMRGTSLHKGLDVTIF